MTDLVVDALAVYRVVRFIQQDTLIETQREWVADKLGDLKIAELVECPWCISPYVAAGVVAARHFAPRWWDPAARVLAFSAVAGVISSEV